MAAGPSIERLRSQSSAIKRVDSVCNSRMSFPRQGSLTPHGERTAGVDVHRTLQFVTVDKGVPLTASRATEVVTRPSAVPPSPLTFTKHLQSWLSWMLLTTW